MLLSGFLCGTNYESPSAMRWGYTQPSKRSIQQSVWLLSAVLEETFAVCSTVASGGDRGKRSDRHPSHTRIGDAGIAVIGGAQASALEGKSFGSVRLPSREFVAGISRTEIEINPRFELGDRQRSISNVRREFIQVLIFLLQPCAQNPIVPLRHIHQSATTKEILLTVQLLQFQRSLTSPFGQIDRVLNQSISDRVCPFLRLRDHVLCEILDVGCGNKFTVVSAIPLKIAIVGVGDWHFDRQLQEILLIAVKHFQG